MEKVRQLQVPGAVRENARVFTLRAPRHFVAAGILSGMILMTPAGASAQFNDVLRNLMQNMLQVPQPGYQAYPPLRQPAYPYGAGVPAPAVSDPATIAELQRMLHDLGYNAGPADGGWGPQSAQALSNFGRDHGLSTNEISAASLNAVRSVWYERNRAPGSSRRGRTKAFPDRVLIARALSLPPQEQFAGMCRLRNSMPKWRRPMSRRKPTCPLANRRRWQSSNRNG